MTEVKDLVTDALQPVAWIRKNGIRFNAEAEPQDDSETALYSQTDIDTLRQALIKCKQQASIMRIWNGMGWTYHPPQAKRIYEAAEAALAATRTGE